MGIVAYSILRFVIPSFGFSNPRIDAFAKGASGFAPYAGIIFLFLAAQSALGAWLRGKFPKGRKDQEKDDKSLHPE